MPSCLRPILVLLVVWGSASPTRAQDPSPTSTRPVYRLEPVVPTTFARRLTRDQIALLEKLNRRDLEHLVRLEQMIVPDRWLDDELAYSPFPAQWPWAESRSKVIVVSQPAQVFAAYESGTLVRWGPVSSGRRETPTPAGVFHLTWKAKSRRSTDNEDWLLPWYFNFINSRGVSFHQFDLPGFAASHACVRLLERDAQWLYGWGEQWTLSADKRQVVTSGSTVVILGVYDFGGPPPWQSLPWWATLLALPADPTAVLPAR